MGVRQASASNGSSRQSAQPAAAGESPSCRRGCDIPLPRPNAGTRSALPLGSAQAERRSHQPEAPASSFAVTVAGSLAVVLGLFFVVAWALRPRAPGEAALLPGEVVEVLGRKVLGQRQQLHLLRCGSKLLLVSVTPDADGDADRDHRPDEVERLAGLCRQAQPGSATATFRQVFGSSRRATARRAAMDKTDRLQIGPETPAVSARPRAAGWPGSAVACGRLTSARARRPGAGVGQPALVAEVARGPGRRPEAMDQPRGAQLDDPGDAAADGAQPGAGRAVDDDLLRADRRGAGAACVRRSARSSCRPAR